MAVAEIHEADIGTILRFTIKDGTVILDISGATTKDILLEKPGPTVVTKAGAFFTDGTDGILQYTTIAADLNIVGLWRAQVSLVLPSGSWKTSFTEFRVHKNLA